MAKKTKRIHMVWLHIGDGYIDATVFRDNEPRTYRGYSRQAKGKKQLIERAQIMQGILLSRKYQD